MDQRRVLVVDDDPSVRKMLAGVFRQKSLNVDEAEDGETAARLLRAHTYSVVLLDLLMPNVNGFQVLDVMMNVRSSAVVLVVTGAPREVIDELDAERIHGIIRKPFDPEEVASIVAACTEIRARNLLGTMAVAFASAQLLSLLNQ